MNNILDKGVNPCSSCGVCAVTCPNGSITISRNNEGFFRPLIDKNKCTQCGICKKVCYKYLYTKEPFENYFLNKEIYAAWSKDKTTRKSSSSGGVAHELIRQALKYGYKICGVIFDSNTGLCKHLISSNLNNIETFKGSKYLQSYTVEAFSQFKKNEKYLVIGTPCQIYGLRKWIQHKGYENNFILIDFFCHGTPSYLLWEKYQKYIQQKYKLENFKEVLFRSKEKSTWHQNSIKITDIKGKVYLKKKAFREDIFFKFFLSDSCLNDSCYQCKLRLDMCASDFRVGDFWGTTYKNNKEGVSILIKVRDSSKLNLCDNIIIEKKQITELQNSQPTRILQKNNNQQVFNSLLLSDEDLHNIYKKTIHRSALHHYWQKTRRKLKKIKQVFNA